jgi:hypothetical protein
VIKRRRDYESFCRIRTDWIQLWQIGNSIYRIENVFNREYWVDLWVGWKGKRLWALWRQIVNTVKLKTIMYYGDAPTTEELIRQTNEMNAGWQAMIKSGALEHLFNSDLEPLEI